MDNLSGQIFSVSGIWIAAIPYVHIFWYGIAQEHNFLGRVCNTRLVP